MTLNLQLQGQKKGMGGKEPIPSRPGFQNFSNWRYMAWKWYTKERKLQHSQCILKSNDWSTALLFVLGCDFLEYIYVYFFCSVVFVTILLGVLSLPFGSHRHLSFQCHTAIHMHSSVNIVCLCCKCECFNVFVLSFLQATMGLFYYYWLMERFWMCWVKSFMGKLHGLQNYDLLLKAWFNRSCLIWSSNTNKIKGGKLMAISDCHNQISCLEMMTIEKILSNRIAWYFVLYLIRIYFVMFTNISYLAGILCALG